MTATRVGIDLVSVASVRESLEAHGDHYLRRVFTEQEVADSQTGSSVSPERLAARFAAKEAAIKALRVSPDEAVPLQSIEVVRHPSGWLDLRVSGRAAELAAAAGITSFAVSVTHEGPFAAAIVVAHLGVGA